MLYCARYRRGIVLLLPPSSSPPGCHRVQADQSSLPWPGGHGPCFSERASLPRAERFLLLSGSHVAGRIQPAVCRVQRDSIPGGYT